ncbi:MAG TPA: hypothetical protein VNY05_36225 [Candidatus Acidoferrales bacterium]|jgi:hypothetical protein|nr:hypothetical protein [Candidatus Acidoferrales bacterium]
MTGNQFQIYQLTPALTGYRRVLLILLAAAAGLRAADGPYFVTYSHQMEEPGSLEVSFSTVVGRPEAGHRFMNTLTELEYGWTGWWTSELYLHGQTTARNSTVFTGYR